MNHARIAIVRLSALGDIINSAVVLQFIREHCPDAQIEWVTEKQFVPLLQPHPLLHRVHGIPLKQIKREKRFALLRTTIKTLRALGPYDIIIDMQGLLKSAVVARLVGPNVHGFDAASAREKAAALFYRTKSRIPYETNVIRRNCDVVGDALGFRVSDEAISAKTPVLTIGEKPGFLTMPRYIAVVVGASWPSKCYPPSLWAQVCAALPLPCLLVWGSETEKADAQVIAGECENAQPAPALALDELRGVIGHADLTLGGDTGPTHLAWALNRPSVVLYGPTTPRMMFETPQNRSVESDSRVDILHIDKTDMSIATISPERIIEKARELL
jgi:heptosyltransferase I